MRKCPGSPLSFARFAGPQRLHVPFFTWDERGRGGEMHVMGHGPDELLYGAVEPRPVSPNLL
jgi:hypothetical protein